MPLIPLIFAAVSFELRPLLKGLRSLPAPAAPKGVRIRRYEGPCGPVDICLTGMGPDCAERAGRLIATSEGSPRPILSIGLAGALTRKVPHGSLFRCTEGTQVTHLTPLSWNSACPTWKASLPGEHFFRSEVGTAHLVTVPEIVTLKSMKAELAAACPASTPYPLLVDMETSALYGALVRHWGKDFFFLSLRAVSDTAEEDLLVDFSQFQTFSGKPRPLRALTYFLREPSAALALMRLIRHSELAARTLATAAKQALS